MLTREQAAYRRERFAPAIAMRNAREQAQAAIDRAVELYARTPADETELRKLFAVAQVAAEIARADATRASMVAQGLTI